MHEYTPRDEHGAPHHELPHHHPKRVHVAGLVQPPPVSHLRRHVEGGSLVEVALVRLALLHAQRQAEVGDLGRHLAGAHRSRRAAVHGLVILQPAPT